MHRAVFLAASLALLLLYQAAPLSALPTASDGILRLPLRRSLVKDVKTSPQSRDVSVPLTNNQYQYLIDLEIGSNNQPITLTLDTGSSEIWVFSESACHDCQGGTYDKSTSKSDKKDDSRSLDQSYLDNTRATGDYYTETIVLNGNEVKKVNLGVATASHGFDNRHGIMGIGPQAGETTKKHDTFLENLHDQHYIKARTYSVHLNDIDADGGSIIFGGDDKSQYKGDLVSLPIFPKPKNDDDWTYLQVELTTVTVVNATGAYDTLTDSDFSIAAGLDTGSTTTRLPVAMFYTIYTYFGGNGQDANGDYILNCNHPDGHISFGFGKGPAVTIEVPFSELFIVQNSGQCLFGLQPQDLDSALIFGDTFLRSAYVKYDFDNKEIGLAQSVWT